MLRATPAECLYIEDVTPDAETGESAESNVSKAASPKAKRLKGMLDPNQAAGFPRYLRQREKDSLESQPDVSQT